LAQDADLVIRFQGGNNAGHTVVNDCTSFLRAFLTLARCVCSAQGRSLILTCCWKS
jgi:adenylosuccinate synthase